MTNIVVENPAVSWRLLLGFEAMSTQPVRTVILTWNERQFLMRLMNEYDFTFRGKAIVYFGKVWEELERKLMDYPPSEAPSNEEIPSRTTTHQEAH